MATAPLPRALEVRLTALAARVRLHRVVRGASRLAVAALLGELAVIALDAAIRLSVASRCLLQVAWLGSVGGLAWRWVGRPWRDAVPLTEVAGHLERQFPGLGERLLTVVELRDAAGPEHGSPHLIHSLANETEVRTRSMDFAEAAPARPVVWLAGAAGFVLFASLVAAVAVPGSGDRLRRVGLPWHRPAVVVAYRVVVSSGNPVVKRGDPVTLTAYVERTDSKADVPDAALLVFRDAAGSLERKLPMAGDAAGAFHVTRPGVAGDFEYRVQVGPALSDWHTVMAADPVELTDQTTADIAPPQYATSTPKRSVGAPTELDGLQHSSALLNLKFNRTCATAFLDWRPETSGPTEVVPVSIAADALSGTATFSMKQSGVLRIVTINENGPRKLRSESVLAVRVIPDAPPRFEQVSGVTTQPRTVRPGEHVPITLTATDDIAVATAKVEYVVGSSEAAATMLWMPLDGLGTPRAHGRFVFDLTGKGSEGDVVRFRVRVADNRRLDALKLAPQEAVHPPTGWAELKLSASAPPLEHQEIIGQRDAFRAALSEALKDVKQAAEDADKVRTDSANRNALALHHTVLLNNARDRARGAASTLHDAAREAALTPDLRPLAAATRDIADRTLKDADELLRKATSDVPTDRKPALSAGIKRLVEAADQIEMLLDRNAKFAQDRLDGRKLDALAGDQAALADKAKPDGPPSDELAKLQQELLDRLRKLVADSDPLKRAATATATREAQRLSADAKSIAATVRELDRATKQLTIDTRRGLLAALARTQATTADRAAALLTQSTTAARLAGVTTPKADDFRRVADLLAHDRVIDALTELERLAQATEHVAEAFEKWAAERGDAKLAAVQLAKWQDDLRERFVAATKDTPFDQLPDATKSAFRLEQQAIRGVTDRLKLPAGVAVDRAKRAAATAIGHAVTMLAGDGKGTATAMTTAREAITRLADATPTLAERLTHSRTALDQLRRDQESIAAAVDALSRGADPSLPAPLAKKFEKQLERQQKQLPALLDLDLPGLEARQERTATALKAATSDLSAGLVFDAFASQAWAKRELDRLRSALDRSPPSDDRADDLARRLAAAADGVAALAEPTARQLEPFVAVVQDAQRQLAAFVTPEAVALLHDARESARVAESGLRDGTKPDELKRRVRAAADAMSKLAARLTDIEADANRVKRLAANRRQASEDAKKLTGKMYDPAASTDMRNQLVRESEEFAYTRVGAKGQVAKKKAIELATRLRTHNEPDRQVLLQKSLAEALDELAAQMADIAELTTGRSANPPALPLDPADAFLPSKPLADALRSLAKEERALRDAANGVNGEVARRIRPGDADPLAAIEKKQRSLVADVVEFTRRLLADKDVTAAEAAGKAVESARLAADRLQVGSPRGAKEPAEWTTQRLKQLAATAGERTWGKSALELAARQDAILVQLNAVLDDAASAAARQHARQDELAKKSFELAHMLELAAKTAPPGGAGASLSDAAESARGAEKMLSDAGKSSPAEGEKFRAAAEKMLADAASKAAPQGDAGEPTAAADAVRQAVTAMRQAAGELAAKGDRAAAERAMRQAADALNRAAKSAVGSPAPPPPDGSPNASSQSNGNTGAGSSPTTTGDLTPTLPENWGANWGTLPGDVKGKIVQDLKARYGDDYARVIKLYFEQLAK